MTHQLHCLHTILNAYNTISVALDSPLMKLNPIHQPWHVNHCFEYIRQAIMCAGDVALEGAATTFPLGPNGEDQGGNDQPCQVDILKSARRLSPGGLPIAKLLLHLARIILSTLPLLGLNSLAVLYRDNRPLLLLFYASDHMLFDSPIKDSAQSRLQPLTLASRFESVFTTCGVSRDEPTNHVKGVGAGIPSRRYLRTRRHQCSASLPWAQCQADNSAGSPARSGAWLLFYRTLSLVASIDGVL
jgi:hypothetical protein